MEGDQMTEEDRQGLLNQLRLDLLLRRLGTTVLRRKFKEIYAKLNDGKEWTDGPVSGANLCRSKLGHGAFDNAKGKQKEMMERGDIQSWDLNCLQSVIVQMLTTALKDMKEVNNSPGDPDKGKVMKGQVTSTNWDSSWWTQMSKIRQLANIRHSIAHMPTETLSQGEFDEKWDDAVDALKALGAKTKEIKEIRLMSQSAFSTPAPAQQGQVQGQVILNQNGSVGQPVEKDRMVEERKTAEQQRSEIEELKVQDQNEVKGHKDTKNKPNDKKDEVRGKSNHENANLLAFDQKNESRANSLMRKGKVAGRSGEWGKALELYTRALEVPEISDALRETVYINRSWGHLKMLQKPEPPFGFNLKLSKSGDSATKTVFKLNTKRPKEPKFLDEKFLETDYQNQPEDLTEEVKEFHFTKGIADAKSALQLSPDQKSPKALHCLAKFHQLKGDWKTALTYFDLALDQSDLVDCQLEFDRNVCQLEVLNQAEVEEFNWIPGQKNQTMAGVTVLQDPQKWSKFIEILMTDPQQKLYSQVLKAHFLAQGLSWNDKGQNSKELVATQRKMDFELAVKLYEGAGKAGFTSAIYSLGLLLQEGNGVQRDFSGAVRLFKIVAHYPIKDDKALIPGWVNEGVREAQYRLGLCYEFGLGVGKDEKIALHWYETASGGDYERASRKLGDIYFQGLLGVSKDIDMAFFCWEQAAFYGDLVALTSLASQVLVSFDETWAAIGYSLYCFSKAILFSFVTGTPTMRTAILNRKQDFESSLSTVLTQSTCKKRDFPENEEREPEVVSWNRAAFSDHTLRTLHLLELAQTPEFQEKLEATPNWRSQFIYTDRLVRASNSCIEGLKAFQQLNKLYRNALINNASEGESSLDTDYPPNLREISGVDKALLAREGQLLTVIFESFASSLKLVGASHFRDLPTYELVFRLCEKTCSCMSVESIRNNMADYDYVNVVLIMSYTILLKETKWSEIFDFFFVEQGRSSTEPLCAIATAAVQGSIGKFEEAAGNMAKVFNNESVNEDPGPTTSNWDLLFVQALCCKSAGLTRGVNFANRKKVKEAMTIFQKFLSICPKDEPRRAETHYQLGLCTLYLEKMKVKGQVKSLANHILAKVQPHFTQGEEAEQEFPWKEFKLPPKFAVKLLLQKKMRELEALVKKIPDVNLTSESEGDLENLEDSSFGRHLDPAFKFPISAFPLKLRAKRRIEVITQFRRLVKAAREQAMESPSTSPQQLAHLLKAMESPFSGIHVTAPSTFVGCYEIVEPILRFRSVRSVPHLSIEHPEIDKIGAFTVVQDESGAVFNLQLIMRHQEEDGQKETVGKIRELSLGDRILVHMPFLRLDEDGEVSLVAADAEAHVFHLPPISQQQQETGIDEEELEVSRKCGFCGKLGPAFQCCAKCQVIYYCDKECQTADWKELKHKWICPSLTQQLYCTTQGK